MSESQKDLYNMDLSALTEKRREHVKSCQDNDDNSHKIIAELYSDPSHFVYEILQNSDDAKASEIQFTLTKKNLEIVHNGKKLFSYNDIKSITTVGSTTKKDDINAIGKFGAGFKSVFAVTNTPQIHSGEYHFEIQDFIVPEVIPGIDGNYKTVIILPFYHGELSREKAYQQISDRLKAIEYESLLFLNSIKEIQWKTEEDSGHYLAEIESNNAFVISQYQNKDRQHNYLLFNRSVEIEGENLSLSVAYLLDADENRIIPTQHETKLFVYFPTIERVRLKFLVHVPYKTTPSRESIPYDDVQNQILTSELAILVSDSMAVIKERGYLDVNYLNMLPLSEDEEHPIYRAIYESVKQTLASDPLLPTNKNEYTNAKQAVLARGKELSKLLSEDDNEKLFGKKNWLNTDITSDKTRELRDYLIEKLNIPEVDMEKFSKSIDREFMCKKSDEWVIELYTAMSLNKALFRQKTSNQKAGILRRKPIIRLEDGSHVSPDNEKEDVQVYFPTDQPSSLKTVKRVFVDNAEAKECLDSLGIVEPDTISEIREFIAPKYEINNPVISQESYIRDVERASSIWLDADEYKKKEIIDILKRVNFVCAVNYGREISFRKPEEVYYPTEELQIWFCGNNNDEIYYLADCLRNVADVYKKFLKMLGVLSKPKIVGNEQYGGLGKWDGKRNYYARGLRGFNPDFDIEGLEFALEEVNINRSVYAFKLGLEYANKIGGVVEESSRQGFDGGSHHEKKKELSKAGRILKEHHWLYGKEGYLIEKPSADIALEDLHDKYDKEHADIDKFIEVVGLKLDMVKAFEEKTGLKVIPKEEEEEYEEFKRQKLRKAANEQDAETKWAPESLPEDVVITVGDNQIIAKPTEDLSEQSSGDEGTEVIEEDVSEEIELPEREATKTKHSKDIGDWGERYAKRYLEQEYPDLEVVWLNQGGNVGKGYDFVTKQHGKDIAYYEVKAKVDQNPTLFDVTGTQWEWARKLYEDGNGEIYTILLVSNAGTERAMIKRYTNPLKIWKEGGIYAHPVNIEL